MKIALIGCGQWGRNHLRVLNALEAVDEVVCWDEFPQVARAAVRPYRKAAVAASEADALRRSDACVVAVPATLHHRVARRALDAGLHVMVEKPLAVAYDDAVELVSLAAAGGRTLMVGHITLFHDAYRLLAGMARGGRLGRLRTITATRTNLGVIRQDVNVLMDLGPHDLACVLDLAQAMPEWVSATGAAYVRSDVEDVVQVTMGFPDGVYASVHLSWLDPHKRRELTLVGDQAMATFDDVEPLEKVKIHDTRVDDVTASAAAPNGSFYYRHGGITTPWLPLREPLENEIREFLQASERGAPPVSDGRFALSVQACLDAAQRSLRTGRRVSLEGTLATI